MSVSKLRIVFMGTPEFAVPSLKILVEHGYNIVGVITATDKYGGRGGKKLIESDIKKYAKAHGLNILQPKNLKSEQFIEKLRTLKADLQIVVAFRMLPVVVWDMPPLGTYNLHGSLLPKYRGAAPINWAVIKGDKVTGVTSFKLKHEIDTGAILFQEQIQIGEYETAGELYERMKFLGAEVVLKSVQAIERGNIELKEQDNTLVSKAPKIFKEDCEINFDQNAEEIRNFVRGMNPFPGAWIKAKDQVVKIFKVDKELSIHNIQCGKIESDNKSFLKISTNDGWIHLKELQAQGKKRMDIKSFLNGTDIKLWLESGS